MIKLSQTSYSENYEQARKLALKDFNKNVSKGVSGHLPALEGIISSADIISEYNLGIVELPLHKIVGTYSNLRAVCFADNFMPLIHAHSEFESKWSSLAKSHVTEGIRDPIKVYEYLNYYYVIEGNKRVSVLKYYKAYSIYANVIRLIPKRDPEDLTNTIYYDFMDFNNKTGITSIWFTKPARFGKLLELIDAINIADTKLSPKERYKYFENSIYFDFRKIYHELGGNNLPITTGDAFLEYTNIFGMPQNVNESDFKQLMKKFIDEVEFLSKKEVVDLQTSPEESLYPNVIKSITNLLIHKKKLKIAFVYTRTINDSAWAFSHEIGRKHIQDIFNDQIETYYYENAPEDDSSYEYLLELAKEDFDIIFTTSPDHITSTLKVALDNSKIRFFNCSATHFLKHVSTYWGRLHEPRFITGAIAGAMTKTNIIGYVATFPLPDIISSLNAFALGVKLVNPKAKIKLVWSGEWSNGINSDKCNDELISMGADIVSSYSSIVPPEFSKSLGFHSSLYTVCEESKQCREYLAAPVWHWEVFYENIIKHLLNGTWKNISSNSKLLINFWWGMDSGVVDINFSTKTLSTDTQKLIKFLKRMIISGDLNPFEGPIYDKDGNLRIDENNVATNEEILSMDWLVDIIDGDLPLIDI